MLAKTLATLLALSSLPAAVHAELQWAKPVQEFQCTPDDKSVEAHFTFKNTGSSPVTIKDLKTSCGCTTARLPKSTYAPGESGEVVAVYKLLGQNGALRKTVTVITEDGANPQVLDIRVFRLEPFEVKPSLVYWRSGAANEAKAVKLTATKYPVHIRSVSSSNPRVTATVQTVKEGEQYALVVQPKDTAQAETAEITVTTDYPAASPRTYKIQARVK